MQPISRRTLLKWMAAGIPAMAIPRLLQSKDQPPAKLFYPDIAPGPFQPTRESLQQYEVPEWFRNAKFGIWAHWGPQSAPEYGDWYARDMYIQGSDQYQYHVKTYGHPSRFGFKDIIPTWKADRFDPDYLMGLYKKAGARYFMSMGVHHDNFDLWNSTYNRWNAVQMGPHKDIVGLFRQAALKHDLKFAVSDHLWISYKWFSTSHGSDISGPMAGVPYDGQNPAYWDLYHDISSVHTHLSWDETGIPESWKAHWFKRIKDLIDQYHPDLLYCDGPIPFEDWGLAIVAHLYNSNYQRNGNREVTAVYTSKRPEDSLVGTCVLDVERGVVDTIWPRPWQTDTCIGHWHYDVRAKYKTPKMIIDMLVDIVSRNGNLMLNFPLPNSGMLDDRELAILEAITAWMQINSEAIYDTRPWKIFGYGPNSQPAKGSSFNERNRPALTADDIRFTTKGKSLYVFFMGWPENQQLHIAPLGREHELSPGRIAHVRLLGYDAQITWTQQSNALEVQLPASAPSALANVIEVKLG
ncbi:alpha-L-fucosidase [Thermoflavifilum aggregans]|uniref:alpha-L-fucosidase n=1 Tax=Thermoflavifilum aggregans TaxID=454188 RepID=A0A2M9CSZ6_9BACT|nr:alpha-L-fucosidase [Thermoflavifilum aggregans]PJJ74975.1 alpha-L-fucosidase [Thermoflavifilum aggregans]